MPLSQVKCEREKARMSEMRKRLQGRASVPNVRVRYYE